MDVLIPHLPGLFLSVDILEELEDVRTSTPIVLETLGYLDVHFAFHIGLWVCQDKIDLSCVPIPQVGNGDEEPDRKPSDDWAVGFPEVDEFLLHAAVRIEASFPLVNFSGCNTLLAFHAPNELENFHVLGDLSLIHI